MKTLLFFILCANYCFATEYHLGYGFGVFLDKSQSFDDVKIISFNSVTKIGLFREKIEGGLWLDKAKYLEERKENGYFSYSLGMRVHPGYLYIENFWGLLVNVNTDRYLPSHFNFVNDFGIGLEDSQLRMIGIHFKHISNAGLKSPNRGRNFIYLRMGLQL